MASAAASNGGSASGLGGGCFGAPQPRPCSSQCCLQRPNRHFWFDGLLQSGWEQVPLAMDGVDDEDDDGETAEFVLNVNR